MKSKYEKLKLTTQAYIVHCGLLNDTKCCHVIIDNLIYDFESIVAAVDYLYKLFFVLKLEYPDLSSHIWAFIQKYLYDMVR